MLHAHGKAGTPAGPAAGYVGLPYIDAMDLAYAAADAVLGRCGAMTVAEVSAVGLPAVYVPLPHGNGEQALNAAPVVAAGGGVLVPDAELTGERVLRRARAAAHRSGPARGDGRGGPPLRARRRRRTTRPPRARRGSHAQEHAQEHRRRGGVTVHFIGIGGAGMSGIARILLARGERVTGSDARESAAVLALRALGAEVHIGHDPAHLPEPPATVVVSTAIRESNPELAAARERGLTVEHRSTALAALTRGRRLAAVTGTAGKTSTTSMLTVALQHCGLDPSFAIGGDLATSGSGAHEGTGDIFVARPTRATRPSWRSRRRSRSSRTSRPTTSTTTAAPPPTSPRSTSSSAASCPAARSSTCVDDPGAAALADTARGRGIRVRTYGRAEGGDVDARLVAFRPDGAGARIVAVPRRRARAPAAAARPRRAHGAQRAGRAAGRAWRSGAPAEGLLEGLAGFDGVRRRFEFRGRAAGVAVYDDYAHHPTKVAAQLRAARDVAGAGRVVVAFQPHLYSRTREFAREFGAALGLADEVVVLDVYGAREDPEPGVSGALVAENVPLSPEHVRFVPRWAEVPAVVAGMARSGDLVITMGAGDVTVLAPEILLELSR